MGVGVGGEMGGSGQRGVQQRDYKGTIGKF